MSGKFRAADPLVGDPVTGEETGALGDGVTLPEAPTDNCPPLPHSSVVSGKRDKHKVTMTHTLQGNLAPWA